jgi:hypothetical protein
MENYRNISRLRMHMVICMCGDRRSLGHRVYDSLWLARRDPRVYTAGSFFLEGCTLPRFDLSTI